MVASNHLGGCRPAPLVPPAGDHPDGGGVGRKKAPAREPGAATTGGSSRSIWSHGSSALGSLEDVERGRCETGVRSDR